MFETQQIMEELPNQSEDIREYLANRIEILERILIEDEDFCNREIDSIYRAAKTFFENLQKLFEEKLYELKTKLDNVAQKNLHSCQQNQKQFDEKIDEINQLFSSGKHQQALEQFSLYEQEFENRATVIEKLPKLYMNNIDLNQYFSIDKSLQTKDILQKQKSIENIQKDLKTIDHQIPQSCYDIRYKQIEPPPNTPKPSLSPASPRPPITFSTRLNSSSSTQSLSSIEHEYSKQKSRENLPNIQRSISTIKNDGLFPKQIVSCSYEKTSCVLLTCYKSSIVTFQSHSERCNRWHSVLINRLNSSISEHKTHDLCLKSIGFLNENKLYLFTEREYLVYSSDLQTKYTSCLLLNENNYHFKYDHVHLGNGGIIFEKFIYHIYSNNKEQMILSILELDTIKHIYDENLTVLFPDVKNVIDFCIYQKFIYFLVQLETYRYAVLICSLEKHRNLELKSLVHLVYEEKPLRICPIYISSMEKLILFINDPLASIIHIINNEKYIKSSSIITYGMYYDEENQEILLVLKDGISTININEQKTFFSKLH